MINKLVENLKTVLNEYSTAMSLEQELAHIKKYKEESNRRWLSRSPLLSAPRFKKHICSLVLPKKTLEIIQEYLDSNNKDTHGKGLYLWSESPGSGKTTSMVFIIHELIEQGYICYFDNIIAIKDNIKAGWKREKEEGAYSYMKKLKSVDVTAIDDIGTEKGSDWFNEIMKEIVDNIYNDQKILCMTSNLSIDSLGLPKAIKSRMKEMMTEVHFPEKDFRGT